MGCSDGLFDVPGVPTSVLLVVCVCVCVCACGVCVCVCVRLWCVCGCVCVRARARAPGIITALKISSAPAGASVPGAEVGP